MTPDELYALLPAVHRRRDAEQGGPLRALLAIVAEQVAVVQDDIEQLYDNWFIETCDDWVVPYLGDLVGYETLPHIAAALSDDTSRATGLPAAAVPRRDVADTVAHRRRKGSLALLEDLASGVTGWPARVVEYDRLLCRTQPVRRYSTDGRDARRRAERGGLVDVRRAGRLDELGTPFDAFARTVEVPRAGSTHRAGRYGVQSVGLHLWRLRAQSVTRAPAHCLDRDRACYTFNVLAVDTPLYTSPVPESSSGHVADVTNVPQPISRRALADRPYDFYGPGRSLCVWTGPGHPADVVEPQRIVAADLSDWNPSPAPGQVLVDPVLGRLMLPAGRAPASGVRVTYHHAFSGDIGGGEYPRPAPPTAPGAKHYEVGPERRHPSIADALDQWRAEKQPASDASDKSVAIVEIHTNEVYEDLTDIVLDPGDHLILRAADGMRPVVRLSGRHGGDRQRALTITGSGSPTARIVLDGLVVSGGCVRVRGEVAHLVVRHCTFVPGWLLAAGGTPLAPGAPGLDVVESPVRVEIQQSIVGALTVDGGQDNRVDICDSVVDATRRGATAIGGPGDGPAGAVLTARRTTVLGAVHVRAVDVVENCLLDGEVHVQRCEEGSFRFCWLPPGSRTPYRFHCEPDHTGDPERVVVGFAATRYGSPDYARLADGCAREIRRGGAHGCEPGVFHDLFEPQREDNLRTRLEEYTPAGCDAGLFFVT
ncbi:hypothetical protein [Streptomyces sp. NPDC048057]|uniref:hypothetical protein n=1 Tax=Streptomyces sp. NPDC048057 TaxID=3155628 RepID=UPI0033F9BAA6